jgi:hypothetical protein
MRGKDEQQLDVFSYVSPEQRVPPDHPLRPLRVMVDEALSGLQLGFKTGRPSIAPEKLLRALLLQVKNKTQRDRDYFGVNPVSCQFSAYQGAPSAPSSLTFVPPLWTILKVSSSLTRGSVSRPTAVRRNPSATSQPIEHTRCRIYWPALRTRKKNGRDPRVKYGIPYVKSGHRGWTEENREKDRRADRVRSRVPVPAVVRTEFRAQLSHLRMPYTITLTSQGPQP